MVTTEGRMARHMLPLLAVALVAQPLSAADTPKRVPTKLGETLLAQGHTAVPLTPTARHEGYLVRV